MSVHITESVGNSATVSITDDAGSEIGYVFVFQKPNGKWHVAVENMWDPTDPAVLINGKSVSR